MMWLIDGAGLDDAGPAHHARHAVAAFPVGVLLARNGVVPPSGQVKHLGAVVGRADDDGVVGDAEIVELLEQLADHVVELGHAVGDTMPKPVLPCDAGLRCV